MTPRYEFRTPPMPDIAHLLLGVQDAREALQRAEKAWNRRQLIDALRSAKDFIAQVEQGLEAKK